MSDTDEPMGDKKKPKNDGTKTKKKRAPRKKKAKVNAPPDLAAHAPPPLDPDDTLGWLRVRVQHYLDNGMMGGACHTEWQAKSLCGYVFGGRARGCLVCSFPNRRSLTSAEAENIEFMKELIHWETIDELEARRGSPLSPDLMILLQTYNVMRECCILFRVEDEEGAKEFTKVVRIQGTFVDTMSDHGLIGRHLWACHACFPLGDPKYHDAFCSFLALPPAEREAKTVALDACSRCKVAFFCPGNKDDAHTLARRAHDRRCALHLKLMQQFDEKGHDMYIIDSEGKETIVPAASAAELDRPRLRATMCNEAVHTILKVDEKDKKNPLGNQKFKEYMALHGREEHAAERFVAFAAETRLFNDPQRTQHMMKLMAQAATDDSAPKKTRKKTASGKKKSA